MISELIDYLIAQPAPTTSPVYLALNSANMLTTLGFTGAYSAQRVKLIDTDATDSLPECWVRLWDTGQIAQRVNFLSGQRRYDDYEVMSIEIHASAQTSKLAASRVTKLTRAFENTVLGLLGTIAAGALEQADADGAKKIKIADYRFEPVPSPQPQVGGADKRAHRQKNLRLVVEVHHDR